jgi:hypothetical protein
MAVIVASVAAAISLGSLLYAIRAERRARMPVLVLFPAERDSWSVENVGKGPALNIVIAQGRGTHDRDGSIELRRKGRVGETWCLAIHLRPTGAGQRQLVPWPFSDDGVAVAYTDAFGHYYITKTSRHGTRICEGRRVPWNDSDVVNLSDIEPGASMDIRGATPRR